MLVSVIIKDIRYLCGKKKGQRNSHLILNIHPTHLFAFVFVNSERCNVKWKFGFVRRNSNDEGIIMEEIKAFPRNA